jgi:NADPH:quinone reductase-like Zn-dependent oxidoreductase
MTCSSTDILIPQVEDGEVLVDVYAAGLNFFE